MMEYQMYNNDNADEEDDYDDTPVFTRSLSLGGPTGNGYRELAVSNLTSMKHKRNKHEEGIYILKINLMATTMEDAVGQLRLMAACNTQIRLLKTQADMTELLGIKYGIEPPLITDELAGIDPTQLNSERNKMYKIVSDRAVCEKVMTATYLDLALNHTHGSLAEYIKHLTDREQRTHTLMEEAARNKAAYREVMKNMRQQRNRIRSAVYDTDAVLDHLRSRIEDSTLEEGVRIRYVDRWQNARTEQHNARIHNIEAGPSDSITYFRKKFEEEQRVHTEVEVLNNIEINETLRRIEDIMAQYEEDLESIDLKIQRMRNSLDDKVKLRDHLEETIKNHAEAIREWVQFKTDRENDRLYRLKMTTAAVVVQAWWRGLLVRLQIGPYAKKKKKPGKKTK